jgi:hypothetical protein
LGYGTETEYINPYQVVKVSVSSMESAETACVIFTMTDGSIHSLTGSLAWNASRLFSGLGDVAAISEWARATIG